MYGFVCIRFLVCKYVQSHTPPRVYMSNPTENGRGTSEPFTKRGSLENGALFSRISGIFCILNSLDGFIFSQIDTIKFICEI